MPIYFIINVIVFVPAFLGGLLHPAIDIFKDKKSLLISILFSASFYIIWDFIATYRGDWSFNREFLIGIYFFNLPLEEILFFFTVPFASLMIYKVINVKIKNSKINLPKTLIGAASLVSITLSIWLHEYNYTSTVLAVFAVTLLGSFIFTIELLQSKNFWIFMLFVLLPFLLVNSFLTAIPIVSYGESAILGIRIGTIPLEDFIYNFAMLTLYTSSYHFLISRNNTIKIISDELKSSD